jgi:hypothetical protein
LILCQIPSETLWQQVLREQRVTILQSADGHDLFLDRLLDYLLSKGCIQPDQKELVKRKEVSKERMGTLLDFLSTEGPTAFDELCTAIENYGTVDKKNLANSLRQCMVQKENAQNGKVTSKFWHVVESLMNAFCNGRKCHIFSENQSRACSRLACVLVGRSRSG